MAAHLAAEAAHDVDAIMATSHPMRKSFLMVKYSTLQSPFVMFILHLVLVVGSFTRFVFPPLVASLAMKRHHYSIRGTHVGIFQ